VNTRKLLIIILTACLISLTGIYSHALAVDSSVDITSVGMGARPISLGGAYVGLADDASAMFTNPAGLAFQKKLSFVSMSTQLLTCVDYKLAGFSDPTDIGTFGIGYIGVNAPGGKYTYMNGVTPVIGDRMYYSNSMFILSYARDISDAVNIKNVGVGASVKFLSQGLDSDMDESPFASGMNIDLGAIYSPSDRLSFGATIQNIYGGDKGESIRWSTGQNEKLPQTLKAGCSYQVLDNVKLLLDMESNLSDQRNIVFHGGSEWQVIPLLALRIGFDQKEASTGEDKLDVLTSCTAGIGIEYSGFRFDYAYRQDTVFPEFSSHYFSLSFSGAPLGEPDKTVKKTIPVNTDTCENDGVFSPYKHIAIAKEIPLEQWKKRNNAEKPVSSL